MMNRPDDGPRECDFCGYPADFLTYHEHYRENLCDLCASTATNTYSGKNPRRHSDETIQIMKTICYVGNSIISAIRDLNS